MHGETIKKKKELGIEQRECSNLRSIMDMENISIVDLPTQSRQMMHCIMSLTHEKTYSEFENTRKVSLQYPRLSHPEGITERTPGDYLCLRTFLNCLCYISQIDKILSTIQTTTCI